MVSLLLLFTILSVSNAHLCSDVKQSLKNNKPCSIVCNAKGINCQKTLGAFFGPDAEFKFEKKQKCIKGKNEFEYKCSKKEMFYKAHIDVVWTSLSPETTYSIIQCAKDMTVSCFGTVCACKVPQYSDYKTDPFTINTIVGGEVEVKYISDTKFGGGMYMFPCSTNCSVTTSHKQTTTPFSEIKDKTREYYEIQSMLHAPEYYCGKASRIYHTNLRRLTAKQYRKNIMRDDIIKFHGKPTSLSNNKLLVVPNTDTSSSFLLCYTTLAKWEFTDQHFENIGFKMYNPEAFTDVTDVEYPFVYEEVKLYMKKTMSIYNRKWLSTDYAVQAEDAVKKLLKGTLEKTSGVMHHMYEIADHLLQLEKNGEKKKEKQIMNIIKKDKIKYRLWKVPLKCAETTIFKDNPISIQQTKWQTIPFKLIYPGVREFKQISRKYGTIGKPDISHETYSNQIGCYLAECILAFKAENFFKVTSQTKLSEIINQAKKLEKKLRLRSKTAMDNVFVSDLIFIGLGITLVWLFICFVFGLTAGYWLVIGISMWNTRKETQ